MWVQVLKEFGFEANTVSKLPSAWRIPLRAASELSVVLAVACVRVAQRP